LARATWSKAFFCDSGVPSVLIVFKVQPSESVACLMMVFSSAQLGVPQETK
jgi:hypothetical protein